MSLRFHFGQAIRSLRKSPGYVVAFVLTLGLAIGVNSAVFSVVNGVLLQPLPFQEAERLLYLKHPVRSTEAENVRFSFMELDDIRAGATTIDELVEFGDWNFTVIGEDEPHRAVGGLVTSNYFGVLGMRPAAGRLLDEDDDALGAEPVMLLTDQYWERTFGRDPQVVGRILELDGAGGPVPTRIVGVLEPGLHYTGSRQPDFYVNYASNPHYEGAAMRDSRTHRMTDVFARLAPGASLDAARAELSALAARMHAEYPETYPDRMGYELEAVRWQDELTRRGRATFLTLMGTVAVILLLATANVANLTLTRLIRKENELATRGALGARGADLRLHLMAENVLLALGGGVLGLGLAFLSRDSLAAYAARFTVRAQEVGVDWTVLAATLGGGILVAVVLAWLPGMPVNPGLNRVASTQGRATDTKVRKHAQRALVVGQLALSFALVAGAGLLVRSLVNLSSVDPGFETTSVVTLQAPSFGIGVGAGPADRPLFEQALAELSVAPGVRSAAVATWAPLVGPDPLVRAVRVEGMEDPNLPTYLSALNNVTPGYFETLGMRLVAGRFLDESDREETEQVVVINESMARAYFGDASPVDRQISLSQDGRNWTGPWRVVGVVADAHEHGIGTEGIHTLYRPATQTVWGPTLLVSAQGDPSAVARMARDVIRGIEPARAVDQVHTLAELHADEVAPSRLNATLFGSFAALALAIAAVGVLGTLGFSVSQRIREFGVRMALGADRGRVLGIVLGEGAAMLVLGLVLGAAAALALGRFLSGLLFGVSPVDGLTLASAAMLLAVTALAAALMPAVRATRVQPTDALKAD